MTRKPSRLKATHGIVDRFPYIFIVFVSIAFVLWDRFIPHIPEKHYRRVSIGLDFIIEKLFPVRQSVKIQIDDIKGLRQFVEILKREGLNDLAHSYEEILMVQGGEEG